MNENKTEAAKLFLVETVITRNKEIPVKGCTVILKRNVNPVDNVSEARTLKGTRQRVLDPTGKQLGLVKMAKEMLRLSNDQMHFPYQGFITFTFLLQIKKKSTFHYLTEGNMCPFLISS